jgi:hypothetical protein
LHRLRLRRCLLVRRRLKRVRAEWRSHRNGEKGNCYAETRPGHDALRRRQTSTGGRVARRSHEARGRLNHVRKSAGSPVGEPHLAAGLGRAPEHLRLPDGFKKSLSMSGEVGSLAGDRGVSHERSRPADLPRRHRLCSRHAGSYPSHYCGCSSRRALLAYGHRCWAAVTRRERSHAPGVNFESDRSVAGRPRNDTIRLGEAPRSHCLRAFR